MTATGERDDGEFCPFREAQDPAATGGEEPLRAGMTAREGSILSYFPRDLRACVCACVCVRVCVCVIHCDY